MKIIRKTDDSEGFEPVTPESNSEEGFLQISGSSSIDLLEEGKIVADKIVLRCELKSLPIQDRTIKVGWIKDKQVLSPTLLYEPPSITYGYELEIEHSQIQAMSLEYTGQGFCESQNETYLIEGNQLPEGQMDMRNPLYMKPFVVETQPFTETSTSHEAGKVFVSPPGVFNASILRGYGGYYKAGIRPEEIQQIYYSLTSLEDQTRVRLFSSKGLHEKQIVPPEGGKEFGQDVLFFPKPKEEEFLSLAGCIASGFCHLTVLTEWGTVKFSSFLCEPVQGHPSQIYVHYRPN
jgi:hypothetical protein